MMTVMQAMLLLAAKIALIGAESDWHLWKRCVQQDSTLAAQCLQNAQHQIHDIAATSLCTYMVIFFAFGRLSCNSIKYIQRHYGTSSL